MFVLPVSQIYVPVFTLLLLPPLSKTKKRRRTPNLGCWYMFLLYTFSNRSVRVKEKTMSMV